MKQCEYGCGQEGKFYFKWVNKWCCENHSSKCPSVKNNIVKNRVYKKKFDREKPELCDYGCGQKAIYQIGKKWCCNKSQNTCSEVKRKNSKSGKGKRHNINLTIFKSPITEETRRKMINSHIGKTISKKCKEINRIRMLNGGSKKLNSLKKEERMIKLRKTKEEKGQWTPKELYSHIDLYRNLVYNFTKTSMKKKFNKQELELRGKGVNSKEIDHNFSVTKGFKFGILPRIIGSKSNLRLVDGSYNRKKINKCDITLEELFKCYDEEIKNENV
jgi:hypothetical protein